MNIKFLLLALLISAMPTLVNAESVVWNKTVVGGICNSSTATCKGNTNYDAGFVNPNISITYNVRVINPATGEVVPRGGSVTKGTVLRYEFVPHEYTDIYWFATAKWYDSPYGDWMASAARPPGSLCLEKNFIGYAASDDYVYATLSIAPPAKSISIGATCVDGGGDTPTKTCTLTTPGVVNAQFQLGSTFGYFYLSDEGGNQQSHCTDPTSMTPALFAPSPSSGTTADWATTGTFKLDVPVQNIDYPITVTAPAGTAPSTPTLNSGGACTLGTPHSITISATDSDGDRVRYGIDWDGDGSVDEYAPSSGYVNSGVSQTVNRTYATAGSKTVKVLAQDEGGLSSGWASITFTCSPAADANDDDNNNNPPPPTNCPVGYTLQNNTCVFTGCPSGFTLQGSACVMIITQCTASNFCIGDNLYHRNAQCTQSFIQQCLFGCSAGACRSAPSGTGDITALPSLIQKGGTATVSWQTSGMVPDSCLVTDNNSQIVSNKTGENGSFVSGAIQVQTVFTLTCTRTTGGQFSDSVTINVVPVFIEN